MLKNDSSVIILERVVKFYERHCRQVLYVKEIPPDIQTMEGIEKSLEIVRHSCYKEVTSLIHSFIHLQKNKKTWGCVWGRHSYHFSLGI